ncbi:MFS transporter [Acidipila sp. EB88]|uniref:MFS transporter n=1 Tax=Acidipila sp. EB88 TaxID=2305226 RepID=UPI000F5E7842|nr:MFS transporter [Acidipila sp. EB88]RRA47892.1 MFS transporter [Acidipila sp. EB88]
MAQTAIHAEQPLAAIAPPPIVHAQHSRRTLLLLSLACGVGVSNIYYNQPLLLEMAHSLHVPPAQIGQVAVATQIGYALGIFLFVPLGDVVERRNLMMWLFAAVSVSMLASALAPSFAILLFASVITGLTAAVTHVAVPIAPELARDEDRGRAVGTAMTGLLLGILLARTFSGALGSWFGWRSVFYVGAGLNLLFVPLLRRNFPLLPPRHPVRYAQALRSLWTIAYGEALLRESALVGGLVFAAFSTFWTTLVFLLGSPHYHLGPGAAGAFGVLGATGALVAPFAGRMTDRHGTRAVMSWALLVQGVAFALLWATGYHLLGLIVGVVLLDGGAQANQIANQTRIFGIDPTARGRINTVYMMIYFGFGSAGSAAGALAWQHAGWPGVCALALVFLALAGFRHGTGRR